MKIPTKFTVYILGPPFRSIKWAYERSATGVNTDKATYTFTSVIRSLELKETTNLVDVGCKNTMHSDLLSLLDKFKVTSEHVLIIGHCPLM